MIKDLKGSKLGAERFIRIEAGSFEMGSKETEVGRDAYEGPVRIVTIKDPFYIGAYLVTQGEWEKIVKHNPSCFKGEGLPVENVSWNDVQGYIKWLNENCHPHVVVTIEPTMAEINEGVFAFPTNDYLLD